MRDYLRRRYGSAVVPDHIWCGVSVEDHDALVRVKHLQEAPVANRFLSIEPLLGSIIPMDLSGISWVIVGGESGPYSRPMEEAWAVEIRDLCEEMGVLFFFKQWGGKTSKSGGRLLEGKVYDAVPSIFG